MADELETALENYIKLLRTHTDAVRKNEPEEKIRQLADEMDAADDIWRDAMYDQASFDDPFNLVGDEGEEEGSTIDLEGGDIELTLSAQLDFVVRDAKAFTTYVQGRITEANPELDEESARDQVGIPVAALDELFAIDGFPSKTYEEFGLVEAGSEWSVRYAGAPWSH
jgi:hypothetical protein